MLGNELTPAVKAVLNELSDGNWEQRRALKQKAFFAYLKTGDLDHAGPIARQQVPSPAQVSKALDLGMDVATIKATYQIEAQESLGGFIVAAEEVEAISSRLPMLVVARGRARVATSFKGSSVIFPVITGGNSQYASGLRGRWVSESVSLGIVGGKENMTMGAVRPPVHVWHTQVDISKSLLEDAGPLLLPAFEEQMANAIGVDENIAFMTGPGVGKPQGVLAVNADGNLVNNAIQVTNSGAVGAITADGLLSMLYWPGSGQYRAASTFCISMNANTLKQVRLLKDGAGRYIYNSDTQKIEGYTVAETEACPDIAAGSYPIVCGDWQGYGIADRVAMSMTVYHDSAAADRDCVTVDVRRRVGGNVIEPWRFSAMKVSA